MKTAKHGETGIRCTTYWDRKGTLFLLMRPEKRLWAASGKKRPKFTHRVGLLTDPRLEELKARACERFKPEVEALLTEMERKVACSALRSEPQYPVTFAEAKRDYCDGSKIKTVKERGSQLERLAIPRLGRMLVANMSHRDVNAVLAAAAQRGLSEQTVTHLRNAIMAVIKFVYVREQIPSMSAFDRVRLPEFSTERRKDPRPRVQLTDEQIGKLVAHPETPEASWRWLRAASAE